MGGAFCLIGCGGDHCGRGAVCMGRCGRKVQVVDVVSLSRMFRAGSSVPQMPFSRIFLFVHAVPTVVADCEVHAYDVRCDLGHPIISLPWNSPGSTSSFSQSS